MLNVNQATSVHCLLKM